MRGQTKGVGKAEITTALFTPLVFIIMASFELFSTQSFTATPNSRAKNGYDPLPTTRIKIDNAENIIVHAVSYTAQRHWFLAGNAYQTNIDPLEFEAGIEPRPIRLSQRWEVGINEPLLLKLPMYGLNSYFLCFDPAHWINSYKLQIWKPI